MNESVLKTKTKAFVIFLSLKFEMAKFRMQAYRERLKAPGNEERLDEIRRKNRENSRTYKEKLLFGDPEEADDYRRRRAKQYKKSHQKQKLSGSFGYESKRGLDYAVNKIERELPSDFLKKKEIVKRLSEKYLGDESSEDELEPVNTHEDHHSPISEKKQKARDFYFRDDISRQMPGIKNYKLIKMSNGEKEKVQTRFMTMSCEEAFELYKAENSSNHVGKTIFYMLRPPQVLLSSKTPHDVCSCQTHQDMAMLLESLRHFFTDKNINSMSILLEKLVCSTENYICMAGNCIECNEFEGKMLSLVDESKMDQSVNLVQWETKNVAPYKIKTVETLRNLLKKFNEKFPAFKVHSFVTKAQHQKLREIKENLQVKRQFYNKNFRFRDTSTVLNRE